MPIDRKEQIINFLQADPNSSFLLFALAKEYENEKNMQEAIVIYEKLILFNPDYTGAYYHLGKQYILLNQLDKAREVYHKGIEMCKKNKAMHDASELRGALDDIEGEE